MTKHNCGRCGNDEDAKCVRGECAPDDELPTGIPEPDVGDGFEFCDKEHATDACNIFSNHSGWTAWVCKSGFSYNRPISEYRFRRPIPQPEKSPARLETEAMASNELSREFLLATIVELVTAWDGCDGPLMMKPDVGVPRFVKAMGVAASIAFGGGKLVK